MIHIFKLNGVKAAVDSRDGSVSVLDNLSYLMIPEMPAEPSREMPTSLRYALAKYDSKDLASAYKGLYELFTAEKDPYIPEHISSITLPLSVSSDNISKLNMESAKAVCIDTADTASNAENLIEYISKLPCVKVILKAPWETIKKLNLTDEKLNKVSKIIVSADYSDIDSDGLIDFLVNTDNTAVEFEFSSNDELSKMVINLFNKGVKAISAYPKKENSSDSAIVQYEKLSRELLRYRKKGGTGTFAQFEFDFYSTGIAGTHIQCDSDGNIIDSSSKYNGQFTEYYYLSGAIAHITDKIDSVETVNKCVECAICLSADEK